jgi:adenylate kinase
MLKKEIIIFLGAPGSGKSTQAKLISKKLKYTKITMSTLLKEEIKKDSKSSKNLKKIINNGDLVPYYISCDLLFKKIKKSKSKKILIDGFPREINQAIVLDYFLYTNNYDLKKIININTSKKECINRLLKRKRKDDTKKAIKERLKIYNKETKKVIKRYNKKNLVCNIIGNRSKNKILNNIIKNL